MVTGTLENEAAAVVHSRAGVSRATNFRWEINGTDGDIVVTADAGHAQMFPLALAGAHGDDKLLAPLDIPTQYKWTLQVLAFAENVAQVYACLANDLRDGTSTRLTIEKAAATGSRLSL